MHCHNVNLNLVTLGSGDSTGFEILTSNSARKDRIAGVLTIQKDITSHSTTTHSPSNPVPYIHALVTNVQLSGSMTLSAFSFALANYAIMATKINKNNRTDYLQHSHSPSPYPHLQHHHYIPPSSSPPTVTITSHIKHHRSPSPAPPTISTAIHHHYPSPSAIALWELSMMFAYWESYSGSTILLEPAMSRYFLRFSRRRSSLSTLSLSKSACFETQSFSLTHKYSKVRHVTGQTPFRTVHVVKVHHHIKHTFTGPDTPPFLSPLDA